MVISDELAANLIKQDENHPIHILDYFETKEDRPITPNPYYHYQKRKLLLKYKKQLVENHAREEMTEAENRMKLI